MDNKLELTRDFDTIEIKNCIIKLTIHKTVINDVIIKMDVSKKEMIIDANSKDYYEQRIYQILYKFIEKILGSYCVKKYYDKSNNNLKVNLRKNIVIYNDLLLYRGKFKIQNKTNKFYLSMKNKEYKIEIDENATNKNYYSSFLELYDELYSLTLEKDKREHVIIPKSKVISLEDARKKRC